MDVRVALQRELSTEELMLSNCGVEKTLKSPLDSKESNQSISPLEGLINQSISPLEGLMLKLKLQYFGHLI